MKKTPKSASNSQSLVPSFFHFFRNDSRILVPEDDEEVDIDPEDIEDPEFDLQLGGLLRDEIIPRAVQWFTGEAAKALFNDSDGEGEEEDDDDEDGPAIPVDNDTPKPECKTQ